VIAGRPTSRVPVPAAVRSLAAGEPLELVWRNDLGGLTFAVGDRVVKWMPAGRGIELSQEATRLGWAAPFTPVPAVLDHGRDRDGSWLVTRRLPGRSAVDAHHRSDPHRTVTAVGIGLRALHESLPVQACPFEWSAAARVADVHRRADAGLIDPARWHDVHRRLSIDQAQARIAQPPPIDQIVVCHGDACAPNTLLDDDGAWSAHVDFGALGVGDRWADLAIATWSIDWNFGAGYESLLLDAYGIDADPDRIDYYRLLWDLDP
jgi:kanamycin kinase